MGDEEWESAMRYHEWILQQLRKEREMAKWTLPLDLPYGDDELLGRTTCGWRGCNKSIKQSQATTATNGTLSEHFCDNHCRDKWRDELPVRFSEH